MRTITPVILVWNPRKELIYITPGVRLNKSLICPSNYSTSTISTCIHLGHYYIVTAHLLFQRSIKVSLRCISLSVDWRYISSWEQGWRIWLVKRVVSHSCTHHTASDPKQRHFHQFYTKLDLHIFSLVIVSNLKVGDRWTWKDSSPVVGSQITLNSWWKILLNKGTFINKRFPSQGIWHFGRTSISTSCPQLGQLPPRFSLINDQTSSIIK